jgi:hypothetical protein
VVVERDEQSILSSLAVFGSIVTQKFPVEPSGQLVASAMVNEVDISVIELVRVVT